MLFVPAGASVREDTQTLRLHPRELAPPITRHTADPIIPRDEIVRWRQKRCFSSRISRSGDKKTPSIMRCVDKSEANGRTGEAGNIMHAELLHDMAPVDVRCARADAELGRNFFGRVPFRNELQNLAFT